MTFSKAEVTKAYRAMETDSGGDRQKDTTTDRKEKGGRDSERDREKVKYREEEEERTEI